MATIPCGSCGKPNEAGARFCAHCGKSTEDRVHCPSCTALQSMGTRYCMQCGAEMGGSRWQKPEVGDGAVIEGVWQRGAGEFIRRVDPEDARSFLGSKRVRIPAGTIGVVLVDGVVDRVLAPGEETTLNLFERIARFFTRRDDRTAFYLVDLRPIPVPFVVHTRPTADGRSVQSQVLVSFTLQRGNKQGIAAFIENVVGGRQSYGAEELFDLLRPEVTRIAERSLERLSAPGEGPLSYADAEALVRSELEAQLGPRYGLTLQVSVAPLTSVATVNFHLGTGKAPLVRACASCRAELPSTMKFCDRCGARQPAQLDPDRACDKCAEKVPSGNAFCLKCGHAFTEPPATATPLFTVDDRQVEVDVVVRVQGQHEDFAPDRIAPALVSAAAAHLRGVSWASLTAAQGFTALEAALRGKVEAGLAAFGLLLSSLSVVDVRSKTGQWLLAGRADLDRARQEVLLGREWLGERAEELQLAELTFVQALARQHVEREAKLAERAEELEMERRAEILGSDDALARDQQKLDDRHRREGLVASSATLDVTDAERSAARDVKVGDAAQTVTDAERARRQRVELDTEGHAALLARRKMELDSERQHRVTDDTTRAARAQSDVAFDDHERRAKLGESLKDSEETRQLEKLKGMAELDRQMSAQEHFQVKEKRALMKGLSEREMIALQAAELARSEGGGAAWAQALAGGEARKVEAEHAEKLAAVMKEQLDRMEHLTAAAMDSTGPRDVTTRVYEKSMDSMSRVAASRAAPTPVAVMPAAATTPCKNSGCDAQLPLGTEFCGSCGTKQ